MKFTAEIIEYPVVTDTSYSLAAGGKDDFLSGLLRVRSPERVSSCPPSMAVAMVSTRTGIPVRRNVVITGERGSGLVRPPSAGSMTSSKSSRLAMDGRTQQSP
jgi:hypothetical protein